LSSHSGDSYDTDATGNLGGKKNLDSIIKSTSLTVSRALDSPYS